MINDNVHTSIQQRFFFSPINKPLHTKRLPQRAASRKKTLKEKNGKKQNEWSL